MAATQALRTDLISGLITSVVGLSMVLFGTFGLAIVGLQKVLFSLIPPIPQDETGTAFMQAMDAVHFLWLIYLPLMIAGGVVFAVSGFRLRNGSILARRIAQANAVLGFVWLVAYTISCYRVSSLIPFPFDPLVGSMFRLISVVGTTLFTAAIPGGLLYILSRP